MYIFLYLLTSINGTKVVNRFKVIKPKFVYLYKPNMRR